jgi:D-alanyl-D-alanine carboxypeptidase/D-alanyl-D-alanine-endopeptidase (penicillin-binding protein 4)
MAQTLRQRFFVAAFICLSLAGASYFTAGASAQETQRTRTASATPTPTPALTPKPSLSPTPAPKPVQSLPDLQARINSVLLRPEFRRGQIGVKVVSLDSGKTLFETNGEKYFMPASNMKIFTVATAMMKLTPNFRFVTSVYAGAKPDASGVVKGDLTIYGRGDPSLAAAFNNGDYFKGFNDLADKIVQAGVKRVEGGLVGDESYFNDSAIPNGWEWDDLQWYYGAEVSALTSNDNSLDVTAKPGSSVGAIANVTLNPAVPGITLNNKVYTAGTGSKRSLGVFRPLSDNNFEVFGSIPINDSGTVANVGSVAVARPAQMFVALLRQALERKGVIITGANRVVSAKDKAILAVASSTPWIEITKLESPPFSVIAANTLKPSQNLYTELILRAMGETIGDKTPGKNSFQRGAGVVANFLREVGIDSDAVLMADGSGLSRHNLITPNAVVQLYTYMSKSPYANIWRDALPIGGVDGTLKGRLKNPAVMNNVHAKTGTLDQVSSLSGYLTTAGGERLAFSILSNDIPSQTLRQNTLDEIALILANFNGKTN